MPRILHAVSLLRAISLCLYVYCQFSDPLCDVCMHVSSQMSVSVR